MNTHQKIDNLRKIGKLLHAHGLRGELYLLIFSKDYSWFEDVSEIYLDSNPSEKNSKLRFKEHKIKSFRPHKEGLLVTLADINNRNQSDEVKGLEVWVASDIFVTSEDADKIFLVEIEGFKVYDGKKEVGTIVGFTYNGAQDLLVIERELSEANSVDIPVEIPFVEDFIESIDYVEKKVIMNLPEGLIEAQMPDLKTPNKNSKKSK